MSRIDIENKERSKIGHRRMETDAGQYPQDDVHMIQAQRNFRTPLRTLSLGITRSREEDPTSQSRGHIDLTRCLRVILTHKVQRRERLT